jgi:hypothetical protein
MFRIPNKLWPIPATMICFSIIFLISVRHKNQRLRCGFAAAAIVCTMAFCIAGCGGGGSTVTPPPLQPLPGSYPFTVTATVNGAPPKNIQLTLNVQ